MYTKKCVNANPMTDSQLCYLARHTCQWCQAVLKQGERFIDALEQIHGDLPWDENEQSSMFLADKVFLVTAIHHAILNLERFNNELRRRKDFSFSKVLDVISTSEERNRIRVWRNMNEHDIEYLTGCGNRQDNFVTTIKKENYQFMTDAFTTLIHEDAGLFLVGEIEIDKLLMKIENNLPEIRKKTEQVFMNTFHSHNKQ